MLGGQRNSITHLPCWPTQGPGRGLQKQVKIHCEAVLRFSQSHAIYSAYCIVILKLSRAACTENTWSAVPITETQQTLAARTRDAVPHAVWMLYLFPVHQNLGRQLGHVAVQPQKYSSVICSNGWKQACGICEAASLGKVRQSSQPARSGSAPFVT